jgi:hypothetical protein
MGRDTPTEVPRSLSLFVLTASLSTALAAEPVEARAPGAAPAGTVRVGAHSGAFLDEGAAGAAGVDAELFLSPRWSSAGRAGFGLGAQQRHLLTATVRRGFGQKGGLYVGAGAGHRRHAGEITTASSALSADATDPSRDASEPIFTSVAETERFEEAGAVGVLELGGRWTRDLWTLGVGATAAQAFAGGAPTAQGVVSITRGWSPRRDTPRIAAR